VIVEDQRETIDVLASPATYPGPPLTVERIDTHGAIVFLAGDRAYKLKRAVKYDYMDFSTRDRRRAACQAEVALNRRTAPDLYLGVLDVTRQAGGRLGLGGHGPPIDHVVEMIRFDEEALFDRLAARGALPVDTMPPLAEAIAALHACAEPRPDHGGREGMAWVVDGNARGFAEDAAGTLDAAASAALTADSQNALARQGELLDRRREHGRVRRCHGDLHLRNIVMRHGRPTLFDAVEFNDRIACIDTMYDLAFLLMDLWRLGLAAHANQVFNAYLDRTGDFDALPVLPLFLSCRAAVRAKTSATAARLQPDPGRAADQRAASQRYLALAADLLHPRPPVLVAIAGAAGSGKSTLGRQLAPLIAPAPGALIARSDVVRKALAGVGPLVRLPEEAYSPGRTAAVYRVLTDRAAVALGAGHSVIVDAVLGAPPHRGALEARARAAGARFVGLWLSVPFDVAASRIRTRTGDASDATVDVLRAQWTRQGVPPGWHEVDATGAPAEVLAHATRIVGM
jgi:hypothetical protein